MTSVTGRPPSRWAASFDAGVIGLGALCAVVAVAVTLGDSRPWNSMFLLSIPLIMIMGLFPILLGRPGAGLEVGLDSCVLIFLAEMLSPAQALLIWCTGTALTQLLRDRRPATRVFNMGLGALAGGIALVVITVTRTDSPGSPRELLAIGLGAAVYFLVDYTVSAVSLSLEESTGPQSVVLPGGTVTALAAYLAIASLGYLAALVFDSLPPWSTVLLAVPIATILVASRALTRGSENARRLTVMFDAAVRMQTVADRQALLDALRISASDLLGDTRVTLREAEPGPDEIGVEVQGSQDRRWLVGPALSRARSNSSHDQQGLNALVAVADDAFARLSLSAAMTHQAWHDPLTGLSNRSLFMERVTHALQLQSRRGSLLAVLFCDLDGFKRVNDLFGHAVGDELLIEVAKRVKSSVRAADTVSRLGGDEFAVLLEDVCDVDEVSRACQRILDSLRTRMQVGGEDVSVTVTIGVAMSEAGASADALLSRADLAMYYAKSLGKNRFETYRAALGDERRRRIELVESLRRAVEDRQLRVVYQPVVQLAEHRVVGVEALVRWRRPDGVLVPPDLFIPTAEESGLIIGLGEVVLDTVAEDMPSLRAAAGDSISVGVNVSAQQLVSDGFAERVRAARAKMGDVELILEVTERDFVHHDPRTLAAMDELAAVGVRFAIDDFGVGFSSIGYLQRLPVHILKVDKSFLTDIEDSPRSCSLVRSVVTMGESLGLDVVIEGIEREGQLERLVTDAGATLGQGYFFAKPMPRNDVAVLLSAQRTAARPEPVPAPILR